MNFEEEADLAQRSLEHYFRSADPLRRYNNVYPLTHWHQNDVFNYWWVAHLVDSQLDAFSRSGEALDLRRAEATYAANKARNHGTLLHVYYDDELWNALAAVRLYQATGTAGYLADAQQVCSDMFRTAWNEAQGGGFAWTRMQLDYKNTPANAPAMILALRLYQLDPQPDYLEKSLADLAWLRATLVDAASQFVADGINRLGDGQIDVQWPFSYNQGVYIGALIEFYHVTGERQYLEDALTCAHTTLARLAQDGVLVDVGEGGGDVGLFKGIFYRYAALLVQETGDVGLRDFILSSCAVLAAHAMTDDGWLLAKANWRENVMLPPVDLAEELSAVMALEAAASLEAKG
ncbi:glycoside hydrolase family 76 protein [Lacticaseibacillus mingshuiensis]|uniref:Glycoside hydrolase family 76 protein n=1 Tax=Lacticaseibacillus mingshuiensis TaxID=2799574 RepID=A0ABW4CHL5_9LACO|nr:glycoside hydrolase family 76 protein [Lacticaseibacillus mingshuiensis]